ncbi:ec0bd826-ef5a-4d11-a096-eac02da907fc [Sclerotinia trifoliorum]|uniref:Ec0bd826-ef5a-4d11-a096-eac02da907fc n=1 Tax=Sclerotinia trifoliorum TaxID=28548 RepID=A0A8H2VVD6_9HELO|nr:ec0bd826-ef5a-4d11-a096-eac02da907fc [Sclerotinia trifoliorum]
MASRIFTPASRVLRAPVMGGASRNFSMSVRRATPVTENPLPVRKPVGAFRGGLFGFLLGSTLAGAGVYYYILEEYKVSNELLTEDIYSLQNSVQRVHTYVQSLEEKLADLEKKKK